MGRVDDLNRALRELQSGTPDIEGCALISEDGLMIASALSADMDEGSVGGMSATIHSLGTRSAMELARGDLQEVLIRGDNGYAVMISAGEGVLLLALTSKSAKLGLVFLDMRRAVNEIAKAL